ncbi:MAG: dipeptidase [Chitinispirillia bacterium]|jgi:acetylornithine deacetylase/succinyl-diaminopimelate desuccinylase-like protein
MDPLKYISLNEQQSIDQLKDFLRIPSVSARSEYNKDMTRCAEFLKDYLNNIGIRTTIVRTKGFPIVFGEYEYSPHKPTVLIYGHYDVQPPDPLNLWKSSPFNPVIENGYIIARGAVDNKGQIFAHIKALEAYLKTGVKVPVNIKILIEGEEEVLGENLADYIRSNKKDLNCDIAVVSDGSQFGLDLPAINYGLRGIIGFEVKVHGPSRDLHSGSYGGAVANPINILCKLISRLHDDDGHVSVDGFYENIIIPAEKEQKLISEIPFSEKEYFESINVKTGWGEKEFSTLQRTWIRPTLDCNGITGGYQGEGGKTIIPAWASTKITCRLVPEMDPKDIFNKIEKYLKKICPEYVTLEIDSFGGCFPIKIPVDSPWLKAASTALKAVYKKEPLLTQEGGSIPIVETFKTELGIDTLLIGFGQHNDNAHSPNERFLLKDFIRGAQVSILLLDEISKISR